MALTSFVFFWRSSLHCGGMIRSRRAPCQRYLAEKSGRSTAFHGPVSRLDVGREALLRGPVLVLGHAHFLLDLVERLAFSCQPADALEEQRVVFFAFLEDLHRAGRPVPGNHVRRVRPFISFAAARMSGIDTIGRRLLIWSTTIPAAENSTRSFGSHTAVSDSLWTPFRWIRSNVLSPTLSAIFWWYSTCGATKR